MSKYKLELIDKGGKKETEHAAFILESYNNGGVFKALDRGYNKDVHAEIIVDAVLAWQGNFSREQIIAKISERSFSCGNTSSWNKLINDNLHWIDSEGNKITFADRFGGGNAKPNMAMIC